MKYETYSNLLKLTHYDLLKAIMFKSLNYKDLNKTKSPCLSKFIFQLYSDFEPHKNLPFSIGIIVGNKLSREASCQGIFRRKLEEKLI